METHWIYDSAPHTQADTEWVPVESLVPADSPRLTGLNYEHAKVLAQVTDRLPPLVVHRSTMRVVDGMHRLSAARIRGKRLIEVRFFEGDGDAAFVLSVRLNMANGLPLTLADRTAAAERILATYPERSDRSIASTAGLSAATVAAIRARSSAHLPPSATRVGRDGRTRPVNGAEGRRLASLLIAEQPDASLREIARGAGISPATVRDVRDRLKRGDNPIPPKQRQDARPSRQLGPAPVVGSHRAPSAETDEPGAILGTLRRDPSLRFNDAGRALLIWLDRHAVRTEEWGAFLDAIPLHCVDLVVELAHQYGRAWTSFAAAAEHRSKAVG